MNTRAFAAIAVLFAVYSCTPDRIVRSDETRQAPLGAPVSDDAVPNQPPVVADVAPTTGHEGNPVLFSATAFDPDGDGSLLQWFWDFGDGTSSTEPNPSRVYVDNGVYPVTLSVYDDAGRTTVFTSIEILDVPPKVHASLSSNPVAVGETVTLTASFEEIGALDGPWTITVIWDSKSVCKTCPKPPPTVQVEARPGEEHTFEAAYEEAGDHNIRVLVTDKDGNQSIEGLSITVVPGSGFTDVGPAMVWTGLKNSDAVGLRIDLLSELYVGGVLAASGELLDQPAGSSGFNNAILRNIDMNEMSDPKDPKAAPQSGQMTFQLSVRRTCTGTGHKSGTVRLWYDGDAIDEGAGRDAGSRFSIGTGGKKGEKPIDWFLRSKFLVSTDPGTARQFADVAVNSNAACPDRPYQLFGKWSENLKK